MTLTHLICKNSKPKESPYKMFDGGGLYLLVNPNGNKHWRLKYRYYGKEKLLSIGPYPLISLIEAREARDKAKKLLLDGTDPGLEKRRSKQKGARNAENTFEAVAREWHERRKHTWKGRYRQEILRRLEQDVFPEIGFYPITEIDAPLLLDVMRKIEARGALEVAKKQLQKCGEIFRYAIACGKAVRDPAADIKGALTPIITKHYAAIESDELPALIQAIERNDARLYHSTRNALKLIMLTFVRTSELINARWVEFDFEQAEWIVPAERMKMGREHCVPLARQVMEILENQKEISGQSPLVFPSSVSAKKSMSNNTILGALKRLGYHKRMTGHGFRALAMSTIKEKLGYRHEVVDRQLAHVPRSKIDQAYDRAQFLEERKVMMQDWADYIDVQGKKDLKDFNLTK
ncbi:MAG: tyrosine-type recombinase/integrase [Ignavibacteriae bacterium]|nr:tyrosine-type recombinase/integrase [Ignavibacteriota bacterium]MCB9215680.1 tyrosine-type recombinase/integrase [Ignavibacteria bacterium]